MAGTFDNPEVVQEELDILLIGGGMACCGAAYEMMRWAEAVKAETERVEPVVLKGEIPDPTRIPRSSSVTRRAASSSGTLRPSTSSVRQPSVWKRLRT